MLPDKAVLAAFADAMFRHADRDSYVVMKAFDGGDVSVFPADGVMVSHDRLADFAYNRAKQAVQWPGTATFCPPVATFRQTFTEKGKWSATPADIANGVAISVDADQAPVVARATLVALLGEPTIESASGGLWVNPLTGEVEEKVHLHWRLRESTRTAEDHKLLYEARWLACMLVDGDTTLVPLSHPLRWPGSVHNKAEPRLSRIVQQTENEVDLVEALTILRTAWDGLPFNAPRDAQHAGSAEFEKTADHADIASAMEVIPNGDLKWPEWKRFGMAIWAATEGKGFNIFEAWSKRSDKFNAAATVEAWDKIAKSPPVRIGAGAIFWAANQADPTWIKPTSRLSDEERQGFEEMGAKAAGSEQKSQPSILLWHGDRPPEPPPWLVRATLPQTGVAILAGQFSAGKTFTGMDLARSVMLAEDFAGREVCRPGGVLWLAGEGEEEVDTRLRAAVAGKDPDADLSIKLPFARQAFAVPTLKDKEALPKLLALAHAFQAGLKERFGDMPLALIIVDTLASVAGFDDEDKASESQGVMNTLRALSRATGALVLVIDHYGKMVETGVRGSSAKSGAADAILATLADKSQEGDISNRRMAVVKLRGGATGQVTPFELRQVQVDAVGNSSCCVKWAEGAADGVEAATQPGRPAGWTAKGKLLKACLERMLIEHGSEQQPFGFKGPRVKAVPVERVREEFKRSYSADSPEAKRKAFTRAFDDAAAKDLIATREIGASLIDWVWFVLIPDP